MKFHSQPVSCVKTMSLTLQAAAACKCKQNGVASSMHAFHVALAWYKRQICESLLQHVRKHEGGGECRVELLACAA